MQVLSASHVVERVPPMWNVVVSNMPGSPAPFYCAGARVKAVYPLGPVVDGVGLNLTFLSNAGRVDIGAMACRELIGDLEGLASGIVEAVEEMSTLVG